MGMKVLEENGQQEKGKLEHWKLAQNSPKRFHFSEFEIFLVKLA